MSQKRTDHVLKNSWYGFVSKISTVFLSFIGRTVFVRTLGIEYLGVGGLFSNILTMLSLTELGIGNVLAFSLYRPIAESNHEKINQMLSYYRKLYNIIAILVAIIGVAMIQVLPYIVNSQFSSQEIIKFYLLYLLNAVISYIAVCYTTLIKAEQEGYIIEIIDIATRIIVVTCQIFILYFFHSFVFYLLMSILGTLMQNIFASLVAKHRYKIKSTKQGMSAQEKKALLINIKSVFVYKLGVVIVNYTDNILISVLVGTIFVGYYSNYALIVSQCTTIFSIICVSLLASIGNLATRNDRESLNAVFKRLILFFNAVTTVFTIGFILLFNDFITLWLGSANTLSLGSVVAISFTFYISNIINPVWVYREACGLFSQIKYIMLATATANIILSIIGGKAFGIAGIIGATGISRCLTTVWYEPNILYNKIFMKSAKEYFLMQSKYIICGLISLAFSFITCRAIPEISRVIAFIIRILIITSISLCIFTIVNFKSEEMVYWTSFIRRFQKKKNKNLKQKGAKTMVLMPQDEKEELFSDNLKGGGR